MMTKKKKKTSRMRIKGVGVYSGKDGRRDSLASSPNVASAHHRRTLVSPLCECDDSTGAVCLLAWGDTNGHHRYSYSSPEQREFTKLYIPREDARAGECGLNCYSIRRPLATTENGSATLFAGRPQRFHRFWDFYRHQVLRLLS